MIDWSLAPEGAVAVKLTARGKMYFSNGDGFYYHGTWKPAPCTGWETIATRPTQTKTVKDAWEAFGGEWVDEQEAIYDDIEKGCLVWGTRVDWGSDELVCTREEFEAYGREQEAKQEGEKWTHLVNGSECVLLDPEKDCYGYYIIKTHYGAFELAKEHELKPIKPTITKAEHEFLCKFAADVNNIQVVAEVESYLANHDIVK